MSIIIRNMKMPKQGRVALQIGADGTVYVVDKCQITAEKYEKNFEVFEIQPHGRLIDADALDICKREQQAWQDYEHDPDDEYLEGVKDGLHEASKQLSTAMTIIGAEI